MQNQSVEKKEYGRNEIIQSISIKSGQKRRNLNSLTMKQMLANN